MSGSDPDATLVGAAFGPEPEPAPAERIALAADDLRQQVTAQLRMYEGCEAVSVLRVTRLDKPDRDGCNWASTLVLDSAGVPAETYGAAYALVIVEARSTWNLR